ncbi:FRG domain-containing protein [Echinicola marina]|uniref:FRG domain-containing protein n=1 Tax=Echinicola marina TaxID=2859768 RepID=UPI001CF67925|nr:FRG domain-containing protein [Echinicola marina]UCS95035.1 FRG domain-containing protein [Echinicola marina]
MQSLIDLTNDIHLNFSQEFISLEVFDFKEKKKMLKKQPKYLFRGERTELWIETKSTFSRNLLGKPLFNEVNHWISGHHYANPNFRTNTFSLYYFLREAVFGLTPSDQNPDPNIELSIIGIMQHYDFDTSFFDLTSDLNIAAYFATLGSNIGDIGQLMIVSTKSIEDKYFDLSQEVANRPKTQSSFVLWGTPDLNLKSNTFTEEYGVLWRKFQVTQEDIERFRTLKVLSTKGDRIAQEIYDWYDCRIDGNTEITCETSGYFKNKIDNLKQYGG